MGRQSITGRELGEFVVGEKLGEGGSAVVYRGEQPALGREVVIKVLRGGRRVPQDAVQRFLREARLASRLDHPFAAHIYASGVEDDGLLWIAMEMVRGTPLDEVIRENGPMKPAGFAPLLTRICEVVSAAHERGIIHRDIKPANVMVIERSGQLLPKLLDFGIAKLAALATEGSTPPQSGDAEETSDADLSVTRGSLTIEGSSLGSPLYMAPEQWRSGDVDGRADVYALGVLAYEAITGEKPFAGESLHEIARAHATRELPKLPKGLPRKLYPVLSCAVAKRPDDRFDTALDLAARFRAAAIDPAVVRRRRLLWGAALLAVAGGVVGYTQVEARRQRAREAACDRAREALAGIWDEKTKRELARSLKIDSAAIRKRHWKVIEKLGNQRAQKWTATRRSSCLATVRNDQSNELALKREACLDQRLDELAAFTDIARAGIADTSLLVVAMRSLPQVSYCDDLNRLARDPALPGDETVRAEMRRVRASIASAKLMANTQNEKRAKEIARKAVDEAVKLDRPEIEVQARVTYALSLKNMAPKEGVAAARAALRAAAVHDLDGALAEAALVLAEALNSMGVVVGAEDMAALAAAIAKRTGDDAVATTSYAIRGYIAINRGENEKAIDLLGNCVRLAGSLTSELDCRGLRAAALVVAGRIDEGVAEVDKTIKRLEPILVEQSAGTILYIWSSLCGVLVGAHLEERVVELTDRAVELHRRRLAEGDPTIGAGEKKLGMLRLHRGMALLQLGRAAEATRVLERAQKQVSRYGGVVQIAWIQLAEAHRRLGQHKKALALIERLRAEKSLGAQQAGFHALEARYLLDRGKLDAAATAIDAAMKARTGEAGADEEGDLWLSRGRLALARGQRDGARALVQKAVAAFERARNTRRAAEARKLAAGSK